MTGIPFLSLDTSSTYLVLPFAAAVPAAMQCRKRRKYHKVEQNKGGINISNTDESGSCLNRRTHCRPGNFPPLLHHTHIMCRAAPLPEEGKFVQRPGSCTAHHAPCHGLPSAESKPPQASSPQSGGRNECHVEHLDHTLLYDTPQMLSRRTR